MIRKTGSELDVGGIVTRLRRLEGHFFERLRFQWVISVPQTGTTGAFKLRPYLKSGSKQTKLLLLVR